MVVRGVAVRRRFFLPVLTPDSYADIDVNLSIELAINRFGRMIKANPHNDDGALILQDVKVQYKEVDAALQTVIDALIARDYLKQDGLLPVTVQSGRALAERYLDGASYRCLHRGISDHRQS